MREAKTSAWTSEPHFTPHERPAASVTLIFGFDPPASSSTKVNGACGAPSRVPGPPAKSRPSTGPASCQIEVEASAPAATDGCGVAPDFPTNPGAGAANAMVSAATANASFDRFISYLSSCSSVADGGSAGE